MRGGGTVAQKKWQVWAGSVMKMATSARKKPYSESRINNITAIIATQSVFNGNTLSFFTVFLLYQLLQCSAERPSLFIYVLLYCLWKPETNKKIIDILLRFSLLHGLVNLKLVCRIRTNLEGILLQADAATAYRKLDPFSVKAAFTHRTLHHVTLKQRTSTLYSNPCISKEAFRPTTAIYGTAHHCRLIGIEFE